MFRKGLNCALTVCEYILVICNPYVLLVREQRTERDYALKRSLVVSFSVFLLSRRG